MFRTRVKSCLIMAVIGIPVLYFGGIWLWLLCCAISLQG